MTQRYNRQEFKCIVNGREIGFSAWTTRTRRGFCHTAASWTGDITDTKVSYINRTWERFDYETALRRAISKYPKAMRGAMTAQLIDRKAADERDRAEALAGSFERLYNGLSDANKKRLADSEIEIHNNEQAGAVMGLMALMSI